MRWIACPYNVRFFNFYDPKWDKPLHLQLNPDVSVRSVGVMEKCTFCVQRIKSAEIQAESEKAILARRRIQSRLRSILRVQGPVFGDLNDANSEVSRLWLLESQHPLLGELGTKPNVTYLERGTRQDAKNG